MFTVTVDTSAIARLGNMLAAAGDQAPHAIRRGLNRTGDKVRTQVKRALVAQTGLKARTIGKAVKTRRANYGDLSYVLKTRGGNISLKYFGAKEGKGGVTARPWNKATFYGGVFMKSGRKGARFMSSKLGGHVYRNIAGGRWGGAIEKVRSGVYIPQEMVTGASAQAFYGTVGQHLPDDVARELFAIFSGAAPRGR